MANEKKKPPINLNELGGQEEEESRGQPGELGYTHGGPKGSEGDYVDGRDWKGLFGTVILSVFLAGLLILFLTPSKGSVKTLDENILEVNDKVEDVQGQIGIVGELSKKVDTAITEARSTKEVLSGYAKTSDIPKAPDLSNYAKKSDIPAPVNLDNYVTVRDLQDMEDTVADLQDQVDVLENSSSDSSSGSSNVDVTRWYVNAYTENGDVSVYAEVYPWDIEDEGLYEITLELEWPDPLGDTEIAANELSVVLTPRSGDRVNVDERDTWMELYPSGKEWRTRITTMRDGTTRRITFVYPHAVGQGDTKIELEMYLAYE